MIAPGFPFMFFSYSRILRYHIPFSHHVSLEKCNFLQSFLVFHDPDSLKNCCCLIDVKSDSFMTPWTVHGILQARILEWVAITFCRGSFRPHPCILCWQADSLPLSHLGRPSLESTGNYFAESVF